MKYRASLTRDGMENPSVAAYGSIPDDFTDLVLAGDDHTARWTVVLAESTMTFQRTFAESQTEAARSDTLHPGKQVPTSLPGTMYCSDPAYVSGDSDTACVWFDDTYVITVRAVGKDPKLLASVIERIHQGTER
ncbi:hypothetical protein ACFV0O_04805 [Kitasatospora sp. NPDC059577]|uniref:hypothetical protein n=1 Tax=Kitasatospora sp. NPDC059577 TaxID=3346873 RepID=UPI0036A2BB76